MILTGIAPKGLSPLTRLTLLGLGAALLPFSPLAAQQTAKVVEGKPTVAEVRFTEAKPIEGTATIAVAVDDEDDDDDDDKDVKKDKKKSEKVKENKKRVTIERRGGPLTEDQLAEIKAEARAVAEKGRAAAAEARVAADKARQEAKEVRAKTFVFTTDDDMVREGKPLGEKASPELKKAKDELEAAQKKLAEAAQKFAELQAKSMGGNVSFGTTISSDAHVATADKDGRIFVRKLETKPGQQPKMEVRVETLNSDGKPKVLIAPVPPVPPVPPLPPRAITLRGMASDKQEKRIDEMEKKLDRILKELESLKKDKAGR